MAILKAFKVKCDFYDPVSDEYLKCQYLFSQIFELRDNTARKLNYSPDFIIDLDSLYLIARLARANLADLPAAA